MRTIAEMKEQYPWQPGMGEISGMGGDYEEACRKMVYAGLAWLETRPDADLKATTYRNIYGILNAESPDAKALEEAVLSAVPDCSGAMHQAAMQHCMFIAKSGWSKYVDALCK